MNEEPPELVAARQRLKRHAGNTITLGLAGLIMESAFAMTNPSWWSWVVIYVCTFAAARIVWLAAGDYARAKGIEPWPEKGPWG